MWFVYDSWADILDNPNDPNWNWDAHITLIKTDLEAQIELGVSYPFPPLKKGECLLPASAEKQMNIKIGDLVYAASLTDELYFAIGERYNATAAQMGWTPLPY
jgi:hypothetical protein